MSYAAVLCTGFNAVLVFSAARRRLRSQPLAKPSHFPEIGDGLRQYEAERTHGGGVTSNGEVAETGEPFGQKKGGVEVRHGLLWATASERVEGFACGAINVGGCGSVRHLRGHLRGREYLAEVVPCVERGVEAMNRKGADGYLRTIGQGFCPLCPCFAYVLAGRFHVEAAGALV